MYAKNTKCNSFIIVCEFPNILTDLLLNELNKNLLQIFFVQDCSSGVSEA